MRIRLLRIHALEAEVSDGPFSRQLQVQRLAAGLDVANLAGGFAKNARVVAAAQAPVRAKYEQQRVLDRLALLQERMGDVGGAGAQIRGQLSNLARVGFRLDSAVKGLLEAGRGDQL